VHLDWLFSRVTSLLPFRLDAKPFFGLFLYEPSSMEDGGDEDSPSFRSCGRCSVIFVHASPFFVIYVNVYILARSLSGFPETRPPIIVGL